MVKAADSRVEEIRCTPEELVVSWKDTTYSSYQAVWLRDNDPAHRDPRTGQRLIGVTELPADPRIEAAEQEPVDHITLRWQDGARSVFPLLWFRAADRERRINARPMQLPWMGQPASNFAWCGYKDWVEQPGTREDWLYRVARDGVAFLRDVPLTNHAVLQVAAHVGYVRVTNYGRAFDQRSFAQPNHLGVPVRTVDPYREPVPGFLALHCLAASAHGEESHFLDGLAAAERLRVRAPEAFAVLSENPVRYRLQDAHQDFAAERSMIELNPQGQFRALHYDDRSIAPLTFQPALLHKYYAGYRQLAVLLSEPRRFVRHRFAPGDLALVDNTRILHGRSAVSSPEGNPPGAAAHLQGCYIDADGLYSSLAVLARTGGIA